MNIFLIIVFLFFIGSLVGWVIELIYRKFFSKCNIQRAWINPGFLNGPYLPLYGFSLCALYLLSNIDVSFIHNMVAQKIVLFIFMAIMVTIIEYIAGFIFIKKMKIKLWDYNNEKYNINGIVCLRYTFYWMILSAIYYFLINHYISNIIIWVGNQKEIIFFMGIYYGVLLIDLCYSINFVSRISKFATRYEIIVKYESLKESIRVRNKERLEKRRFIFVMKSETSTFTESLKHYLDQEQKKIKSEYIEGIKKIKELKK